MLFNKVAGPQISNFVKKRLQHRFFSAKFSKFLLTLCFTDHLHQLVLTVSCFQPAILLKKRLRQRCLSVNFAIFLITSFDKTPPDDYFLCLSVNFEKLFRIISFLIIIIIIISFLELLVTLGNCLLQVQVPEFEPAETVKDYFTSPIQAFYTRPKSRHSKALIYLESLNIIFNEVNL